MDDNNATVKVTLNASVNKLNRKIKKSGSFIKYGRYSQKEMDREREGHYEGKWPHPGLPKSKRPLSPEFCPIRKKYPWHGSDNELNELIDKMKLRYPKNYRIEAKRGELIEAKGDQSHRLTDYDDPVFNNPTVRSFVLTEGVGILNLSNPLHKFIYLCKKDELTTSTDENQRTGSLIEFSNLKSRNRKKGKTVKKDLKASSLLFALSENEEKLRKIAHVMQLPGVKAKSDVNIVLGIFQDIVVNNVEKTASEYSNKNYRDLFIYFAELKEDDLDIHYKISKALKTKKLTRRATGFNYFHDESTPPVEIPVLTRMSLFDYIISPDNTEFYIQFKDAIK